jgi:hypothetical protein
LILSDLNHSDVYLGGTLKEKVYVSSPHTLEQLQENIRPKIYAVSVQQLRHVSRNIVSQCEACLEVEGLHFETLLSNKVMLNYNGNAGRELSGSVVGLFTEGESINKVNLHFSQT